MTKKSSNSNLDITVHTTHHNVSYDIREPKVIIPVYMDNSKANVNAQCHRTHLLGILSVIFANVRSVSTLNSVADPGSFTSQLMFVSRSYILWRI